jgi:hypothetical protein
MDPEPLKKFMDQEVESKDETNGYGPAMNHLKGLWTWNQLLELIDLTEIPT